MIAKIVFILNMLAAKQNQKFPFHFLSAPPTPPAEIHQKGRKIFGFASPLVSIFQSQNDNFERPVLVLKKFNNKKGQTFSFILSQIRLVGAIC